MGRSFKDIFLIVFPLTGLLFGGLLYYLLNLKSMGAPGMQTAAGLGLACGLVFGVGIGYLVRTNEVTLPVDASVDVYTRLQLILLQMGYRLDTQFQKVVTFEPTLRAGIFADRIRVELVPGQIRIGGPVYHLEQIQDRLGL